VLSYPRRDRRDLASVDGQIVLALANGPLQASEIYNYVSASQPTVSRRLGWLLDQGILNVRHAPDDRRYNIYALNPVSMWRGLGARTIRDFARLADLIGRELRDGNDVTIADETGGHGASIGVRRNGLADEAGIP
jgi:DNA-binding transcriptional ArsR family regulator